MMVLVVVPARGGSQRLPGKNLMRLGDHSLLAWTAAAARAALPDAPILLTTDDLAISDEGRRLGLMVPFLRPAELATDSSSTADAVLHALDWWSDERGGDPDLVVLLQPTSPFRSPKMIRQGTDRLVATNADALVAVTPLHVGSGSLYADRDGAMQAVDPDAKAARCIVPSGALYVIRTVALREHGTFVPPQTLPLSHEGTSALDIDSPDDWALAEAVLGAGLVTYPGHPEDQARRTARA